MAEERLQKVLASAGVASRRACEEIITAGRVKVNGVVVTELGTKVEARDVQITVDDKPVQQPIHQVYVKLYKPRGILGDSGHDEESAGGRESVLDLLPESVGRVFPVGRLDLHSEGLVLLTDDGDLAHKLTHPRFHHSKTYFVLLEQRPTEVAIQTLRKGVDLPEGRTAPALVRLVEQLPPELRLSHGPAEGVWLEITLYEGKKRQIRHMTAAVGYPTLRLIRWSIGPVTLGNLKVREHVHLTQREVTALRNLVNGNSGTSTDQKATRPSARRESSSRESSSRESGRRDSAPRGSVPRDSGRGDSGRRDAGSRESGTRGESNRGESNRSESSRSGSNRRGSEPFKLGPQKRNTQSNRSSFSPGRRTDGDSSNNTPNTSASSRNAPNRSAPSKRKPNL